MSAGEIETRDDLGTDSASEVRYWKREIDNALDVEEEWRATAAKINKRYCDERKAGGGRYNILASNINIQRPALFNSTPIPDIRRRNPDPENRVERDAASILEGVVGLALEDDRFGESMKFAVQDVLIGGRGVVRVRYVPTMDDADQVAMQECTFERIGVSDFCHQPEKEWSRVEWVAFRHELDREQLLELSPEHGEEVKLDVTARKDDADTDEAKKGETDIFNRAVVWEVWDRRRREVVFFAPSFRAAPLKKEADPLNLSGFYPVPRPLYADRDSESLIPLPDFRLYEDQADELDEITRRIRALIRVLRWRGAYSSELGILDRLENADDGSLIPVKNIDPNSPISARIWLMPIQEAMGVLKGLYMQRAEIKQEVYELTGLSDIIRGVSNPNETLGAQRLKAQNATGRLSERQRDVQRLARDLIAIVCEIVSEHYTPEMLTAITEVQAVPEVMMLLQSDQLRRWRLGIETDSTIQHDLSDARENIAQLLQGVAAYVGAFGPLVQIGAMTKGDAVKLLTAFLAPFRLGRQAEVVFDELVTRQEKEQAMQRGQPPQPDPKQQEEEMRAQVEAQKAKADAETNAKAVELEHQREMARIQLDRDRAGADIALKRRESRMKWMQAGMDNGLGDPLEAAVMKQTEMVAQLTQSIAQQQQSMMQVAQMMAQMSQAVTSAVTTMSSAMSAPRVGMVIRDGSGNVVGTKSEIAPRQ